MTFGIAFLTPAYAGIITDRRLSGGGQVVAEEYSKSGIVDFVGGRYAYTFSGLAKAHDFDAEWWLAEAFCFAGAGPVHAPQALKRFVDAADKRFAAIPVQPVDKRFSVLLVGYATHPLGFNSAELHLVSNCESFDGTVESAAATLFTHETRIVSKDEGLVRVIGSGSSAGADSSLFIELLSKSVNPKEAVKAAVRWIRAAADHPLTHETVGYHCSSLVMGATPNSGVSAGYHVQGVSDTYYIPSYVHAQYGPDGAYVVVAPRFTANDAAGTAEVLVTDAVRKNSPCPCSSGRTYKHCHGSGKRALTGEVKSTAYFKLMQAPTSNEGPGMMGFFGGRDGQIDGMHLGPIAAHT